MSESGGVVSKFWQRVMALREVVGWLSGLAASLVALVGAYPVLSQTAHSIFDAVAPNHPSPTVVFASNDRPFAMSYLNMLAEKGLKTRYVTLIELSTLIQSDRPGLLLVHDERVYQRFAHIPLDERTLDAFRRQIKIIAFGGFGADLLSDVDRSSMLGKIMHLDNVAAVFDDPQRPDDIGHGLPKDQNVPLYQQTAGAYPYDIVAANDEGSTALQNVIGLARATGGLPRDPCHGAHWTVAIAGNFALWGYPRHAALLTDAGRTLFTDLAAHMLKTSYSGLGGPTVETPPGILQDQLGCGALSRTYRFRPTGLGGIRVESQASAPVALMLNAPSTELLQRRDESSARIEHNLTAADLNQTGDWAVRLAYFGTISPATSIKYTLNLDYPSSKPPRSLWLIVAGIAMAVAAFAVTRLLSIARTRRLRSS